MRGRLLILILPVLVGLSLGACTKAAEPVAEENEPATIEPVAGTNLKAVTLTEKAAKRLDIQTGMIRLAQVQPRHGVGTRARREVMPAAAVFYDANGGTWTYTNPKPLVFVLKRVVVDYVDGDFAVLAQGPPIGTRVVTVGTTELYGIEFGLGSGEE
jgi:hypothetical protein